MKVTTSTKPNPGMGGFALLYRDQLDMMLKQGSGLVKAEYNYNYRQDHLARWTFYDKKEDTFHFVTEKEGMMTLITLTNPDFGEALILIEP